MEIVAAGDSGKNITPRKAVKRKKPLSTCNFISRRDQYDV